MSIKSDVLFGPDANAITLLLQDDANDDISLAHRPSRPRLTKPAAPASRPVLEAAHQATPVVVKANVVAPAMADIAAGDNVSAPGDVGAASPEMTLPVEPKATAETPVHPQDVDLGIPHQEVTSAYVRLSSLF